MEAPRPPISCCCRGVSVCLDAEEEVEVLKEGWPAVCVPEGTPLLEGKVSDSSSADTMALLAVVSVRIGGLRGFRLGSVRSKLVCRLELLLFPVPDVAVEEEEVVVVGGGAGAL